MSTPPVVSALIETFTSMLADKVLEEVSLVTDFKNNFEFLCDELFSVKLLLDEAGQYSTSRSMSNWLEKLEYFLIEAVDIVDECRASNFGNSIFSNFEKLIFRHKMGSRMRTLRQRINDIHGNAKYLKYLMSVLQINALNAHNLEDKPERSSATLKESHIVGIKADIAEITKLILTENGPQVIAVVGMGGMGKTLLVIERCVCVNSQPLFGEEQFVLRCQRFHFVFQKGWYKFARRKGLKAGDTVVVWWNVFQNRVEIKCIRSRPPGAIGSPREQVCTCLRLGRSPCYTRKNE